LQNKVAKRGRKIVDYDAARHNLETQQAAKKQDEAKLSKVWRLLLDATGMQCSL
jgi:hypothetical protein